MSNIVLLHGLSANHVTLFFLENILRKAGYNVYNPTYLTFNRDLESVGDYVRKKIEKKFPAGSTVHFVGHSLGGLVARSVLSKPCNFEEGRVVTLGTPHIGALLATKLEPVLPIFKIFFGQVVYELQHNSKTLNDLYVPKDMGVIIGRESFCKINPLYWLNEWLMPEGNMQMDGLVRDEENFVVGADKANSYWVNSNHLWMIFKFDVAYQIMEYIEEGQFDNRY